MDDPLQVQIDQKLGEAATCRVWIDGELRFIGTGVTGDVMGDLETQMRELPRRSMFPAHAADCPGRPGYRGMCTCGDRTRGDWVPLDAVLAVLHVAPDPDND